MTGEHRPMPFRVLLFLTIVNTLNYFDRYIVHAVEPTLKATFDLSDGESGLLVSAFTIGYFIFSPFFGYLGDRVDRRLLMAIGLFGWSIATALTGLATTFGFFFFARILVGIGEASFAAIVPGYLKGRLQDTVRLNSALSLFYIAIPVGAALGFKLGGQIAAHYTWHSVFFFAAVPGLLLIPGIFLLAKEPSVSGAGDGPPAGGIKGFVGAVRGIFRGRVLRLAIIGYVFNTFALNGVAAFVVRFGMSLGMDQTEANGYFGLILGITGFVGTLAGGQLASLRARRSERPVREMLMFVSLTTAIGVPFLATAFLVGSPTLFLTTCFFAELALFAGVAPLNSVLVEQAPAGFATLTQGVAIFMINLFGSVMGPVLIGIFSDVLGFFVTGAGSEARCLSIALQLTTVAAAASALTWYRGARALAV